MKITLISALIFLFATSDYLKLLAEEMSCLKNPNFCMNEKLLRKCETTDISKADNCAFYSSDTDHRVGRMDIENGDLKIGGVLSSYTSLIENRNKILVVLAGRQSGSIIKNNFSFLGFSVNNSDSRGKKEMIDFIGNQTFKNGQIHFSGHVFSLTQGNFGPNCTPEITNQGWDLDNLCRGQSIHSAFPYLKERFNAIDIENRKEIQRFLYRRDLYSSRIDGEWGPRTLLALARFGVLRIGEYKFEKKKNVEKLMSIVLRDISSAKKGEDNYKNFETNEDDTTKILKVASGTGFYVTEKGHLLTNFHVINECEAVKLHNAGNVLKAKIISFDTVNDIALLKVEANPENIIAISDNNPYELQEIIVGGYPFGDSLSSTIKFTKGIVSSLSGVGDNFSQVQIDAALQPGNSGGPIVDEYGAAIGIAVSKLDYKKIVETFGVVPENTNFGIKSSVVRSFLEANGINIKKPLERKLNRAELGKVIKGSTKYLSCWMTKEKVEKLRTKKVLFKNLN